jgi:type I restriction enzyme M protein
MWLRASLRNYRSIKKAEVDLAPFTLLVGPNGSGKSNFVDALVLASELGFDAASAVQRRGGLGALRRWGTADDQALEVKISMSAARGELDRSCAEQSFWLVPDGPAGQWKFLDERFWVLDDKGQPKINLPRDPALPPTTSLMLSARQLVPQYVVQARRLSLDVTQMSTPLPSIGGEKLLTSGANIASVLQRLRSQDTQGFAFVLAAMQRLVPGLEDIWVEESAGFLVLRFSQRLASGIAPLAAYNMSEGALRALGIIAAAQTLGSSRTGSAPELLIVEEPEAGIHPGAAALMFDVLKRGSRHGSVLVTTHSPELLDAARDEEILVCSHRQGVTEVGPLSKAQRDTVREGLFSLSELVRSEPLRFEGEKPEELDPRDFSP